MNPVRCALTLSALLTISGTACQAADPASPNTAKKETSMSGLTSSRPRAAHVPPVTIGAVRYQPTTQDTIPGPEHAPGVLGAYDAASGQRLWTLKVHENVINPALEKDVQQDHLKTLTATTDGKLQITTETGRRYEVDPGARTARTLP
jgi:hypothetical protein